MARCFSTPAVHIVEVPISYEASTVLQVTGPFIFRCEPACLS